MFAGCENIGEAHKLSAVVFGIEKPLHLKGNFVRNGSINSGVYEEAPHEVTIVPRVGRIVKNQCEVVLMTGQEKGGAQRDDCAYRGGKSLVASYISNGRLEFARCRKSRRR